MASKTRQLALLTAGFFLANVSAAEAARGLLIKDAWLSSATYLQTLKFNTYSTLLVDGRPSLQYKTFLEFDLQPALPPGAQAEHLAKATLMVYVSAVSAPGSLNVLAINGTWSETALSGITAPAIQNCRETNLPYAVARVDKAKEWVSFDITELVRDWMDGTRPNHGLALVAADTKTSVVLATKNPGLLRIPAEVELVYGVFLQDGGPAPAGASGAVGPVGPAGVSGAVGPVGPVGPAGVSGAVGPVGPVGPAGVSGAVGPVGPVGPAGVSGAVGPAGKQGVQGPIGFNGLPGVPGPVGATGPAGPTGEQGVRGERGEPGPAGPPGEPAPAGGSPFVFRILPRGDISMGAFTQGEKP